MRPETAVRRGAPAGATLSRDSAVERGFNRPISPERHNSSVPIDQWSACSAAERYEHGTAGTTTTQEHQMHVERSVRGTCNPTAHALIDNGSYRAGYWLDRIAANAAPGDC